MEVLDEYRKALDALTTSKNYVIRKKGQGIRKYKQPSIFRQIKSDRWNALLHNSRRFDETTDSFDRRTSCM